MSLTRNIPTPPPPPEYWDVTPPGEPREPGATAWDLSELTITTQEWIKRAKECNVDVEEEVKKIVRTIMDAPDSDPVTHTHHEITYIQQLQVRGMYCSRIIRKIAEEEIKRLAQAGREEPKLQKALIDQCERYLLRMLPSEWQLGHPSRAEQRYRSISNEMEKIKNKLQSKL